MARMPPRNWLSLREFHHEYLEPQSSTFRGRQAHFSLNLLPPLPRIRGLDRSSPQFYDQLSAIIGEEEFKNCAASLQSEDLMWFIQYLGSVLRECPAATTNFRGFLCVLRDTCRISQSLPEPCTFLFGDSDLLTVSVRNLRQPGGQGIICGSRYSVKRLKVYSDSDLSEVKNRLCREVISWERLSHPHVLPVKWVDVEHFMLCSEWMDNGNINEYISNHPNANILDLLSDVAEGLKYLHDQDVIHGNIKGTNILVNTGGRACLADFGHLSIIHGGETATPLGGPQWTAPELLQGRGIINKGTDVYAFGMLAFEVLAGVPPFIDSPPTAVAVQVLSGKRPKRPKLPSLTDETWHMIEKCWAQDPSSRPETGEVVYLLRSASFARFSSAPKSVEGGPTFVIILRRVIQCAGHVSSSLRRFLRLGGSQPKSSPPSPSDHGMKTELYESSLSFGYPWGFEEYKPSETCEG